MVIKRILASILAMIMAVSCLPAAFAADEWICTVSGCGKENTGRFCIECGSPKPVPADSWICRNCESENDSDNIFCTQCGAAKQDENSWICSCGAKNEGNFCPECGEPKPGDAPKREMADETISDASEISKYSDVYYDMVGNYEQSLFCRTLPNREGIVIRAERIIVQNTVSNEGPSYFLEYSIENNGSREYSVSSESVKIGSFNVSGSIHAIVAPGKTARGSICINPYMLAFAEERNINHIKIKFSVQDTKSDSITSEMLEINLPRDICLEKREPLQYVIYNEDGVKATIIGSAQVLNPLSNGDAVDQYFYLLKENNTQAEDDFRLGMLSGGSYLNDVSCSGYDDESGLQAFSKTLSCIKLSNLEPDQAVRNFELSFKSSIGGIWDILEGRVYIITDSEGNILTVRSDIEHAGDYNEFEKIAGLVVETPVPTPTPKPTPTPTPAPTPSPTPYVSPEMEYYTLGNSVNTFNGIYEKMHVYLDLNKHPIPEPDTDRGKYLSGEREHVKVLKEDTETFEYIGYVLNSSNVRQYIIWVWRGMHKDGTIIEVDTYYGMNGHYLGNIRRNLTAGTSTSSQNCPFNIPGEPLNQE